MDYEPDLTERLVEPLTRRELEILAYLDQGLSAPEIAERLTLAVNSVKWYIARIYSNTFVSTNGLVMFNGFGSIDNHDSNDPIPTPGRVDNYASCYWTDQAISNAAASGFWYETQGSAPNRSAVITFVLADQFSSTGDYHYQMILYEDGLAIQFALLKHSFLPLINR